MLHAAQELALNGRLMPKRWSSGLLKIYSIAYSLEFGGGESLVIQMAPWEGLRASGEASHRRRFLRCEWNPAKASLANAFSSARIGEVLGHLIPGFSSTRWHQNMHVTRLDLAFDLYRVSLDGICISALLRRAFSGIYTHHRYGAGGRRTGLEIGKPDSDCYLRVYDKNLERQYRQNGGLVRTPARNITASRVLRRTRSCVRFELQLRDVGLLERLGAMSNPYDRYTVREISGGVQNDHVFGWFLDSCRLRGMQAALSTIANQRQRTAYIRLVRETAPPPWWNAETLWREVPAAIGGAFRLQP